MGFWLAFLGCINCLGMAGCGAAPDPHGQDSVVLRFWLGVLPRCESGRALRKPLC